MISYINILFLLNVTFIFSSTIYVSNNGSDLFPGSFDKPIQSIQKGLNMLIPGDSCIIRGGIYNEVLDIYTSGTKNAPMIIKSFEGEIVLLKNAQKISGNWDKIENEIYRIKSMKRYNQLYVNGQYINKAQWPNKKSDKWIDRNSWGISKKGSIYGKIINLKIPESNRTDINGKISLVRGFQFHQNIPITGFATGVISYKKFKNKKIELTKLSVSKKAWVRQPFKLSGSLKYLDYENEWYQDDDYLYIKLSSSLDPNEILIEGNIDDYIIKGENINYYTIEGLYFKGASVLIENCNNFILNNCHFSYLPSELTFTNSSGGGNHHINNISISKTERGGLVIQGDNNIVNNSLFKDISSYAAIKVIMPSKNNIISNNTIFNLGHKGIQLRGSGIIKFNHIYNGGIYRNETALIQVGNPHGSGTQIHNNWVHGANTFSKGKAIGIRCDDQSRNYSVFNNVVWDCKSFGLLMKGDSNMVYNNTVFNSGKADIVIPNSPEPKKEWLSQWQLLDEQNLNSVIFCNIASTVTGWWPKSAEGKWDRESVDVSPGGKLISNYITPGIENLISYPNFQINKSDMLDNTIGALIEKENNLNISTYKGAYNSDEEYWYPGCKNFIILHSIDHDTIIAQMGLPLINTISFNILTSGLNKLSRSINIELNEENWFTPTKISTQDIETIQFNCNLFGETEEIEIENLKERYWYFQKPELDY